MHAQNPPEKQTNSKQMNNMYSINKMCVHVRYLSLYPITKANNKYNHRPNSRAEKRKIVKKATTEQQQRTK